MSGIKARTTMYRGIKMRSRLEADFAAFLDGTDVDWDYEPVCFAGPDGQWLPDFGMTWNGKRVYVEVKPESLLDDDIDPTLERMTVAWLTEPSAILQLMIWSYGNPSESYTFAGVPREEGVDGHAPIWWHSQGAGEFTPWVGMGQLLHFVEKVRAEAEASS